MKKWSFAAALLVGASVASIASVACKKSDATASTDAGADAASTVVTNPNDATRYPYETKLDSVAASVARSTGTIVRKSPPNGGTIATLVQGAQVTEIAQANHAFLVTFTDPADSQLKMGWINDDAFTNDPAPDAGVATWVGHGHWDGGAPTAATTVTPTTPPNTSGMIVVPASGGVCPSGFVKGTRDANCHRSCSATSDCPAGKCKSKVCTIG